MARQEDQDLEHVVRAAVAQNGIESAAIFVVQPGSPNLRLAAAAGIEGPALNRLVTAVRDPAHPIARAMADAGPTFDVHPMAPGGPALRSHLPMVAEGQGGRSVVGVLAVAHDLALTEGDCQVVIRLATAAATLVVPSDDPDPEDELRVARLTFGLSNREVGERLYLSHRTVGSHLYKIFPKLGITSRGAVHAALVRTNEC